LSAIALPEILERPLPGGATLVVARRPGVPLAAARLVIGTGSAVDPAGRSGLAHLVAIAARRGAGRRSGTAIDLAVEALGADLGGVAEEDATIFGLSAPVGALAPLLELLVDVATAPTFPADEVGRLLRRELAELAHDADEPGTVADRAVVTATYGDHPYGHAVEGRVRDVSRIRRPDLVGFHRRWFGPSRSTLVVVGPVEPERIADRLARRLSRWSSSGELSPEAPPAVPGPRRVVVVDKPDATQAQIRVAGVGVPRRSPDYFPAVVANTILGGGFTSRLVESIRVNRGLSYGVRTGYTTSRAAGLFLLSSFTKIESAGELVQVAFEEMERFQEGGPTEVELDRAQSYLAGLFPLSLETHDQWAERICDARILGYDLQEVAGYRERIRAVTAGEARDVCRRHLPVSGGVVLAVGPARQLEPQLRRFGPVVVVPVRQVL
jgi:zinc protease